MRNWIVFTIILISKTITLACGPWYPYGEEIRFSLFSPSIFMGNAYNPFHYNADSYGFQLDFLPEEDPNILLWNSYCENQPLLIDTYLAIYKLESNELEDRNSSNTFVQYLNRTQDKSAIDYIQFAKSCSRFSQVTYDPWERGGDQLKKQRNKKIKAALKKCNSTSHEILKKRYAFLAIRLAYYAGNEQKVRSIYANYFNHEKTDVLDYWARYFLVCFEPSSAKRNVDLAEIFEKCPDKRFAANQLFDREISLDQSLKATQNNREKGNVMVMYALRNPGQCANLIQNIVQEDPTNPQLSFLLLREMNKIEDWILTPKYNLFPPSTYSYYYTDEQKEQYRIRIANDKAYASEFLGFLKNVSVTDSSTRQLIEISKAYLTQITGNPLEAIGMLRKMGNTTNGNYDFLVQQLLLLSEVSHSKSDEWIYNEKWISLLQNKQAMNYSNFLFAVGREAEFNNQTTAAAYLFSHLNKNMEHWESEAWKAPNQVSNLYGDFFTAYFFYLDAQYSIAEVNDLIQSVENKRYPNAWLTTYVRQDLERLYDLLGTKHLREQNLTAAISAFAKVSDETWNKDEYSYKYMLNANPFANDFYTEHEKSVNDTVTYTKFEIAKQLQKFIDEGNDRANPDRAKSYFLAANCYFNMSYYGNSWMMRRYWWSSNEVKSGLIDDDEFARCNLAKEYYKKAYDAATNPKQKALCLRMMGRCEKYALFDDHEFDWDFDYDQYGGYAEYIFSKNKSYRLLQQNYSAYYDELISNCESFSKYYSSF